MPELPEVNEVGLQLREATSGTTTIAPPVAVVGIASPATEVLNALVTPMPVPDVAGEMVNVRTAITPFLMVFVFSPFGPSPVRKQV
jgi:hypothetical protein